MCVCVLWPNVCTEADNSPGGGRNADGIALAVPFLLYKSMEKKVWEAGEEAGAEAP